MAANRKRIPFSAAGPFRARRSKPVHGIMLQDGKVYARDCFPMMHDRGLEKLFDTNWFDMAPDTPEDEITTAADLGGEPVTVDLAKPTGGEGNGAGENDTGTSTGSEPTGDTEPEGEGGTETGDNSGGEASDSGEAGEGGGNTPETPSEPASAPQGDAVAYKSFGFGRYHPVNAAGEKLDERAVGKQAAEGLAKAARVPLLGQNDPLPEA